MKNVFTPILENGVRAKMYLSDEDMAKIGRGVPNVLYGTVTDLITKKRYKVYARSCGSPHCVCDALAKEVA